MMHTPESKITTDELFDRAVESHTQRAILLENIENSRKDLTSRWRQGDISLAELEMCVEWLDLQKYLMERELAHNIDRVSDRYYPMSFPRRMGRAVRRAFF